MKIVHLAQYFSPHVGGVERHLELLNQELLSRGHEVSVMTLHLPKDTALLERVDGVQVARLPVALPSQSFLSKTRYKLKLWWQMWRRRKLLFSADRIHIHDVFFWLIPFLPWLPKKKLFITFHGYERSEVPGKMQVFWHRFAEKMTAGNICVGAFHKVWYHVRPTVETHGAVVPARKSTASRKNDTGVYIGRLARDVGIMEYLHSLHMLQMQSKHVELDVYGDGPQRVDAEQFVKRHGLHVRFYGNVPNAAQFLSSYTFACVSQYLAILESLTAQTPIIAYYNNQMKHDYLRLAPFADWLKIAQTPVEIAANISRILALPNSCKADVQQGKAWADRQTWQNMTDIYEHLWIGKI